MSLSDKIAVVTGGTGALGSVVAERFANEGAQVVATNVVEEELKHVSDSFKKRVDIQKVDVTNEEEVVNFFDDMVKRYGRVDILVNTVGGFVPGKPLTEVSLQDWQKMMNMNLLSTFLCSREALRKMKGQTYGRIINISAMVGLKPSAGKAPYAISKAGVAMLTEIVAEEQKGTGITINAIAPSIILTKANVESMPGEDTSKWVTPQAIADTICFLCSESAGAITGTVVNACGGV